MDEGLNPSFAVTRARAMLGAPATAFAAGNGTSILLNLVQGVLFMRILGPERYGVWLGLLLLFNYGQHTHLGAVNATLRQLPLLRGEGRPERAAELAGAARALVMLTSAAWGLVGGAIAFTLYRDVLLGALTLVLVTGAEVWLNLGQAELKTAHRFGTIAWLLPARMVLNLALLPMVVAWGLQGAYLRWIVVIAVMLAATWRLDPVRARLRWVAADLRALIADGGPILLVGVLFALQTSLDRTFIFFGLEPAAMERYGVAGILMTMMMVVPGAVGQTSYPRMLEYFGRTGDAHGLWPAVVRRMVGIFAVSATAALVGAWLAPWFVDLVLPRFAPGVTAARLLLPGGVMLAMCTPASYFLQTIRRQRTHAVVSAGAVVVQIGLGFVAVRNYGTVEAVAASTSAALALYAIALVLTARIVAGRSSRGAANR